MNAEDKPDEWIISVTDDGIGIDRDYHEKIFVIFQKLHINNEQDGLNGTGMGLAICEKIVKLHNGKIWVNSDVDKGAAFYVSLPKRITG